MENQEPTREQINKEYLEIYIERFSETYENVVDSALDEALNIQRDNFRSNILKSKRLAEKEKDSDLYQDFDIEDYYNKLYQSELIKVAFSLYELKIMYAYKYLEISLKQLYANSFNRYDILDSTSSINLLDIYSKKNIKFKKLDNFKATDELRVLNNYIKHSRGNLNQEIKKIIEFKEIEYVQTQHLKAFYERVKDAPKAFIAELSGAVYDELFKDRKSTNVESRFDIPEGGLTYGD